MFILFLSFSFTFSLVLQVRESEPTTDDTAQISEVIFTFCYESRENLRDCSSTLRLFLDRFSITFRENSIESSSSVLDRFLL